jgi:hypothetical protein
MAFDSFSKAKNFGKGLPTTSGEKPYPSKGGKWLDGGTDQPKIKPRAGRTKPNEQKFVNGPGPRDGRQATYKIKYARSGSITEAFDDVIRQNRVSPAIREVFGGKQPRRIREGMFDAIGQTLKAIKQVKAEGLTGLEGQARVVEILKQQGMDPDIIRKIVAKLGLSESKLRESIDYTDDEWEDLEGGVNTSDQADHEEWETTGSNDAMSEAIDMLYDGATPDELKKYLLETYEAFEMGWEDVDDFVEWAQEEFEHASDDPNSPEDKFQETGDIPEDFDGEYVDNLDESTLRKEFGVILKEAKRPIKEAMNPDLDRFLSKQEAAIKAQFEEYLEESGDEDGERGTSQALERTCNYIVDKAEEAGLVVSDEDFDSIFDFVDSVSWSVVEGDPDDVAGMKLDDVPSWTKFSNRPGRGLYNR